MKSKDKLVTLCTHKAVAPSWHDLSRQKSYATKRQPFSIYCEKFPLGRRQTPCQMQGRKESRPTHCRRNFTERPKRSDEFGFHFGCFRFPMACSFCGSSSSEELRQSFEIGPNRRAANDTSRW